MRRATSGRRASAWTMLATVTTSRGVRPTSAARSSSDSRSATSVNFAVIAAIAAASVVEGCTS